MKTKSENVDTNFANAMAKLVESEVKFEVDDVVAKLENRIKKLEDLTMNFRLLIADTMDAKDE